MIAGTLEIQMLANMARLQADITQGKDIVVGGMAKIESAVASAKSMLASLGVGLGIFELGSYAKGLIEAAAETGRLSERTGIAVGRLSELKYAAELAHVEMGQFGTAMSFFEKEMVAGTNESSKAGQIFKALGVDITQGPNVALTQFAERASAIDDAAVKTAVFRAVFGKAGAEMIEWAKNLKEATDQAKRLGITMSDETAKSAKLLEENLKALKAQSAALTMQWMSNDIGALATMAGNIEKAAESGNKWLQVLKELAKLLAATGGSLKNMPGIIGAYGTAMDKLATQLFKDPNAMRPGEVRGKIGGLPPATVAAAPNSATLAGILAGGDKAGKPAPPAPGMSEHDLQVYAHAVQAAKEIEQLDKDARALTDARNKMFVDTRIKVDALGTSEIKTLSDSIKAQELYNAEIGKTKDQKDLAKKAIEDAGTAQLQFEADALRIAAETIDMDQRYKDIYIARANALTTEIELRNKLSGLLTTGAGLDKIAEDTTKADAAAKKFGATMETALDRTITGTLKGKDAVLSLAQAFEQMAIKIALLEPFKEFMTGAYKNAGGLSGIWGWLTGSGGNSAVGSDVLAAEGGMFGLPAFATGTDYVPRTGLALVHQGERITPAGESGGAPSLELHITNPPGQPQTATQSGPVEWDGSKLIVSVMLDAVQNNPSVRGAFAGALR